MASVETVDVRIEHGRIMLNGELAIPRGATGVVLFAHGSGSSRHSRRNQHVARAIRDAGVGTLLFDLLTHDEEAVDDYTRHLRFDIPLLASRLVSATAWIAAGAETRNLQIGYFGASTGAAAALVAAAELGPTLGAVVSRGGRPDLAGDALGDVQAPTLLVVGELDDVVLRLNQEAYARLRCHRHLEVVPGASHLFEEPGTLDEVSRLASDWFVRHFT
jgi:putative phosphoribosyl transferase